MIKFSINSSRLIVGALALTAVANLVITTFVPPAGQPIRRHWDGSLTHIVEVEGETLDNRYGLYLELSELALGDRLVLPAEPIVDIEVAEGLGGVEVVQMSYDPWNIPAQAQPNEPPQGLFETEFGDIYYWIMSHGEPEEWTLYQIEEGILLVADTIAPTPEP